MTAPESDTRTPSQLFRQYEKIEQVKRSLVKAGLLTGDATPQTVIAKLREVVTPDLFPPK